MKKIEKYKLPPRLENEIRLKRPKLGYKADHCGSRTAAIHLFCISCVGGDRVEAAKCQSLSCPLWQFRPGRKKGKTPEGIPSKQQYTEMINATISAKQRAAGKKLREKLDDKS